MSKIKLVLVGGGKLGGYHADKIAASPITELIGIYDPDRENANRIAKKHNIPILQTLAEGLAADGAVIAAPTIHHAELGLFFLRAGKHVLVEKPLAVTSLEAETLRAEAVRRNLVLQTGHTEKFNPAWISLFPTIQEMTASGPVIFDAFRTSPYSFRCTDVGAVLDIMIHDIELVLSAVKSPVLSVSASILEEFGGYEDIAEARVSFENGSTARFFTSRAELQPERTMKICSRGKRIFLDFSDRHAKIITADPAVLNGNYIPEKVVYSDILPEIPEFMQKHYLVQITEKKPIDPLEQEEKFFAESILTGKTAPTDCGVEAVILAEKIINAAKCRN